MATRREAREWAVQLLFELDMNPRKLDDAFRDFWAERPGSEKAKSFCERLVRGVGHKRERIDESIKRYAENWDIARMGVVDRNVMRLAIYEMLFCEDIPPIVSINEAVDLAKYYSDSESGRFVNGLLDRARKDLKRSSRHSSAPGKGRCVL